MRLKLNIPSAKPGVSTNPVSTPELTLVSPPTPELEIKISRELAWQIAPNLQLSFKYAWAGLRYAFVTQRNFRIHVVMGTLALAVGLLLHLSAVKMAVISLTNGFVLAMELLNTAIESVVDLTVKQTYHNLAKIAKDCAAGAVLVAAFAALLVAGSLIIPPLLTLILSSLH